MMQDIFRVFDSLNYLDNLKFGLDAVMVCGACAFCCCSSTMPGPDALPVLEVRLNLLIRVGLWMRRMQEASQRYCRLRDCFLSA